MSDMNESDVAPETPVEVAPEPVAADPTPAPEPDPAPAADPVPTPAPAPEATPVIARTPSSEDAPQGEPVVESVEPVSLGDAVRALIGFVNDGRKSGDADLEAAIAATEAALATEAA